MAGYYILTVHIVYERFLCLPAPYGHWLPFDLVMISKPQRHTAPRSDLHFYIFSPGFLGGPEVSQWQPLTISAVLGLLGAKALLNSRSLLGSRKPARVRVGNWETWSTLATNKGTENLLSETVFHHPIPSFPRHTWLSVLVAYLRFGWFLVLSHATFVVWELC